MSYHRELSLFSDSQPIAIATFEGGCSRTIVYSFKWLNCVYGLIHLCKIETDFDVKTLIEVLFGNEIIRDLRTDKSDLCSLQQS